MSASTDLWWSGSVTRSVRSTMVFTCAAVINPSRRHSATFGNRSRSATPVSTNLSAVDCGMECMTAIRMAQRDNASSFRLSHASSGATNCVCNSAALRRRTHSR